MSSLPYIVLVASSLTMIGIAAGAVIGGASSDDQHDQIANAAIGSVVGGVVGIAAALFILINWGVV